MTVLIRYTRRHDLQTLQSRFLEPASDASSLPDATQKRVERWVLPSMCSRRTNKIL